jgi:hypothetical protein
VTQSSEPLDVPARSERNIVRIWIALAVLLLLSGLIVRAAPLFDPLVRQFQQFPTEDGYLSLTIARNLGTGNGMTVSDGTIATNGTQPLATLIWAAVFWLTDGERVSGVRGVLLLEVAFALIASGFIAGLVRELFGHSLLVRVQSLLAGALWFASPVALPHTMNCLETGLYAASVAGAMLVFLRLSRSPEPWSVRAMIVVGLTLGVVFLARNDGVFLCGALLLTHCLVRNGAPLVRRVVESGVVGIVALVPASPWLLYNLRFGHIVPVSGRAEAGSVLAANISLVPAILAESFGLYVLLPQSVEKTVPVVLASSVFVLSVVVILVRVVRRSDSSVFRRFVIGGLLYTAFLSTYYGLFFGAGWFLSRYLFPITPFVAVLWIVALAWFYARPVRAKGAYVAAAMGAILLLSVGFGYRSHAQGARHQHIQAVEWVLANVAPSQWVGAVQSGTVGFFHDRTINLDGKVNPEAFAAVRAGRIPQYVLDKGIVFLVDWEGLASWARLPELRSFELVVHDRKANLAVLRRRGTLTLSEARALEPGQP